MSEKTTVARLFGVVQNYDWGVKGSESLVAASHSANCNHVPANAAPVPFTVEEEKPYAELWFGTHPNGCSRVIPVEPETADVLSSSSAPKLESLLEWLKQGEDSNRGDCPYLFKVLSIAKPLSLQLHPDEETAKSLHESRPDIYKDPYDKPEMAMAISNPFEAFCGFRKLKEIIALASVVPAFGELLQNPLGKIEDPEDEEKCLKTLLASLYSMSEEKVRERMDTIINSTIYASLSDDTEAESFWDTTVKTVLNWFGQDQATTNMTVKAHHLFKRLHEAFPYDRGCFAAFFLNYVKLKPGECIFLAPNTIHAYIKGNCLECMRCSDNVVRAGLTPKYQDIETLKRLVDYRSLSVSHSIVKTYDVSCKIVTSGMGGMVGTKSSLKAYIPPITDSFRYYVLRLTMASKAPDLPFPQWNPLMIFVIHGRVKINQTSSVYPDSSSCVTLGAGSALVVKEWEVLGVDNPSKSWGDGDRLHYVDMMTVDASSLQEGTNTEGDAVVLFVLPNVEASRLKRSKDQKLTTSKSKQSVMESKDSSKAVDKLAQVETATSTVGESPATRETPAPETDTATKETAVQQETPAQPETAVQQEPAKPASEHPAETATQETTKQAASPQHSVEKAPQEASPQHSAETASPEPKSSSSQEAGSKPMETASPGSKPTETASASGQSEEPQPTSQA
eukprot:Gregarina_sp_Pseudo_9__5589@NODE_757_length_2262_cov_50_097616_g713_i0_p1_GENE_NODE_757_length_2262_cov_50_097616_g713_i0NODE_757_length_2262_cov_50_097616_g713_i0_p1_ORF_typecomplete_len678_score218_04PMI_typeI/PF01238_21/2_6e81BRK/PF07533_16/0_064Cupin_2/PF07883_11/20Cupin_2/PF07883_11/22AraC_binding/PF02311_19/0_39Borrelia_P83/PF05262_11/5_6_NODE_757_length_2262_cov_50_097616_g713_i01032136